MAVGISSSSSSSGGGSSGSSARGSGHDLVLDPSIRNWGVLPILVFVLAVNLIRAYLQLLGKAEKPLDKEELRRKQVLMRASRLQANGSFLRPQAFQARKEYLVAKDTGALHEQNVPGAVNPMANPGGMMEMVKGQAYFGMTQMGMVQFAEAFFSGFVLVKIPFALTGSFKGMLQRGVELTTLDASYVSAASWMFLVAFGVKDLQRFFMGENDVLAEEAQQHQLAMLGGLTPQSAATPMGFDCAKAYAAARDALGMMRPPRWRLEDVEKRVLGDRYPSTKSATEAFLSMDGAGGGKGEKGGAGGEGLRRRK